MPERPQFELERDAKKRVARDLLAQKTASSRPGQVYHTMTSLQDRMARPGYTPAQADTDQLKALRRDWNRNQKYTPQGMRVSGVTTPMGAQDAFRRDTEVFRQANPQAYGTMYPLSQAAMKLGESGGLWGKILREIAGKTKKNIMGYGKDLLEKKGILNTVDSSPQDQIEYAEKTFGPNMYDAAGPWFGTDPVEDVEISDLPKGPLRVQKRDWVDDITETDTMPSFFDKWWKPWLGRKEETEEIPGYGTSYIDMIDPETDEPWPYQDTEEIVEEVTPPLASFNDSGRAAGIAALYGQGPQWGGTNRKYEDEYRDYVERIGDMLGGPMTYEEFVDEWEGIQQGRPHAGLR